MKVLDHVALYISVAENLLSFTVRIFILRKQRTQEFLYYCFTCDGSFTPTDMDSVGYSLGFGFQT